MRLGLDIAQHRVSFDEVINRARLGERLGFTGVWGFDHFKPMYGQGPGECFEGMTTLAALAGVTSTVRLGLLVTGVTYRHPSVLACQAITVDHASHGRLDVALGAAWGAGGTRRAGHRVPEHGQRFDLLEDTLEIVTRLFTGEQVSYQGRRLSLRNAQMRPVPVQSPRPPIWIGGRGPKRTLPLVARYADMWHTHLDADYPELSRRVDDLARKESRDPADIGRAGSLSLSEQWPEVRAAIERNLDRGIGYLVCSWPSEGADRVTEFAETVAPDYRS